MLRALLLAAHFAAQTQAAQPSDRVWEEAKKKVETAWQAVSTPPAKDAEAERRSYAVEAKGHELFGPAYSRTEAMAILALMGDWLRTPRGADSPEVLLQQAARAAHPRIGDGRGSRSAKNWAAFVDSLSS
jgi:hypothetical protein